MGRKPRKNADKGHVVLRAENLVSGSPILGAPTLVVSDIAAQLAPIAPDIPNTVQRIRHWTREGACGRRITASRSRQSSALWRFGRATARPSCTS